jgi:hypothetical protein
MKRPPVYHSAFGTVENTVVCSRLRRRACTSRSLLSVVIGVITVAGPALIFAASQAGGQGAQTATHSSKSVGAPAGNADNGKQLFRRYGCYECHGSHGQIASRTGPALAPDLVPFQGFAAYVRHPAGSMPPYTERVVSDQDVADIYAFLQSASHSPAAKNIPPLNLIAGRP